MKKINYLSPQIFPNNQVLAGITFKDENQFPPFGFSVTKADILSNEEVNENRKILAQSIKWDFSKIKFHKQVSQDKINIVNQNSDILEGDGMITSEKGLMLVLSLADCCGIMIFSPDKKVIAALHSGWNGTRLNIVKKGLEKLVNHYKVDISQLIVWITPCAGKNDYKVGDDVAKYFPNFILPSNDGKYFLDLKGAISHQLISSGVKKENIEISPESTISDTRFHSYRRDKSTSGRMAAFIGLLQ